METTAILVLVLGLLIGFALGAVLLWFLARSRAETADARLATELAQAKSELAQAQAQAADARAQAADARADAAQSRGEVARTQTDVARQQTHLAEARSEVAEARSVMAEAKAEAAEVGARLAGALAARDAAVARAAELAADRESLANQFKVLSSETLERQGKAVDAATADRLEQTKAALQPLTTLMNQFSTRLTEIEKERVAMSTDLRNHVRAVQNTGEHLRRETHALATALRKPQVRGHWGEMQLRRVAEYAGMVERCDFELQTTTQTSADRTIRPDMRVELSDGKFVFVDAKVPLSAFLEAHETDDERTRDEKLKLFGRNVKTHVEQLSGKQYWKADAGTPEFTVLFLPNEMFLSSASEIVPDLHEFAARKDVVLATPTTLIALLRAVSYGWKQAALAESAAEVFALGRELYDRLGTMGEHVDKTGRSLTSAMLAYNKMVGSFETRVLPMARRFRDLQVTDKELEAPKPVVESTRTITAPELVEDAAKVEPMIGRTRRQDGGQELPERAELTRGEPDLLDLMDEPTLPVRKRGNTA
ncbi:DNA recombination protein RmuC [Granulicoccus sp. GXG6511]|uniref:DNA recombination protein RmuC n=1 Tax=Granulicoccus sp. GXG6511 TaxID=3381351 RepID=UPI003D7D6DA8